MKMIKPDMISLVTRSFEVNQKYYLGISPLLFCDLESGELLPEVALWKFAAEELGKDAAIDAGIPKSNAEYLVAGSVFTPGGQEQETCPVTVKLGSLEKTLYIVGDRHWKGSKQSKPQPFTTIPLDWEHAFGGEGFDLNPIGMGSGPVETEYGPIQYLPNIELPGKMITKPRDQPEPAGFRPLGLDWPQRYSKVGTYDQTWLKEHFPGFASDMDWTYHNLAPEDQQQREPFVGNEKIEILNMHPSKPTLEGRLPGYKLRLFVTQQKETEEVFKELTTHLNTVWLFPHVKKCILVYQSRLTTSEDDAADVLHTVVAAEALDQDKGVPHYQKVLELRLDKEMGAIHALQQSDLLPPFVESEESKAEMDEAKEIFAIEGCRQKNLETRAHREIEEARAKVAAVGLDPDEHAPSIPPPSDPLPEDPVEHVKAVKKMIEDLKDKEIEIREKVEEKFKALEPVMRDAGIDPEEIRAETTENLVGPPTFTAEGELARMQAMADDCRAMGETVDELEGWLINEELHEKWRGMEQSLKDAYLFTANQQQAAPRVSAEESARRREVVVAAYLAGEPFAYRNLTGVDLSGLDLRGADFRKGWLESVDLSGAHLEGANFSDAILAHADLSRAHLKTTSFARANLGGAKLIGVEGGGNINLTEAILMKTDFTDANLRGVTLSGANMMEAIFSNTRFEKAVAEGLNILNTSMSGVSFAGAKLSAVNFIEVDLSGVDFSGTELAGIHFVMCTGRGAKFVNARAKQLVMVMSGSFAEADFKGAHLKGANFRGCEMRESDFSGADFSGSDMSEANFERSTFYRAVGLDAMLVRTDFREADLTSINLMGANLQKADIRGTKLLGANLYGSNFGRVRSDEATNLMDSNQTKVTIYPLRHE